MNKKTAKMCLQEHTSSFYSKCCNLQITCYRMLQKDLTDFECLYLWIIYEQQNCTHMPSGTHVKLLFQVLQLTNYRLQGASKRPDWFQVLVSLNNLQITKIQTYATRDTRQVFIPNVASYKLQLEVFYVCTSSNTANMQPVFGPLPGSM
jgi:hypothetical protein